VSALLPGDVDKEIALGSGALHLALTASGSGPRRPIMAGGQPSREGRDSCVERSRASRKDRAKGSATQHVAPASWQAGR
jgi:hypothetical protein